MIKRRALHFCFPQDRVDKETKKRKRKKRVFGGHSQARDAFVALLYSTLLLLVFFFPFIFFPSILGSPHTFRLSTRGF
jgi:hypothetical protein